jgi:hypothetical protein
MPAGNRNFNRATRLLLPLYIRMIIAAAIARGKAKGVRALFADFTPEKGSDPFSYFRYP